MKRLFVTDLSFLLIFATCSKFFTLTSPFRNQILFSLFNSLLKTLIKNLNFLDKKVPSKFNSTESAGSTAVLLNCRKMVLCVASRRIGRT